MLYDTRYLDRKAGSRRMLLPKQQTQAEAWRLFIVSGSFTWLRRPRLASFTKTTAVESNHPLVRPHWPLRDSTWIRPRFNGRPEVRGCAGPSIANTRIGRRRRGAFSVAFDRTVPACLGKLLGVAGDSRHLSLGVALGERLATVLLLAALGKGELYLRSTVLEVELQRNDGE